MIFQVILIGLLTKMVFALNYGSPYIQQCDGSENCQEHYQQNLYNDYGWKGRINRRNSHIIPNHENLSIRRTKSSYPESMVSVSQMWQPNTTSMDNLDNENTITKHEDIITKEEFSFPSGKTQITHEDITKLSENAVNIRTHIPEYNHYHSHHNDHRGEILIHRPAPIIVKRPPTKVLVNHPPLVVKPAPVIFHRPPAVIVRPVIVDTKPQGAKIEHFYKPNFSHSHGHHNNFYRTFCNDYN